MTQLPTWAVVALDWGGFTSDGAPADECARHAFEEGAQVVIFEIPSAEVGLGWVDRLLDVCADTAEALASATSALPRPPARSTPKPGPTRRAACSKQASG